MAGFRLHPGPLPEQYRMSMQVPTKKKLKKKKNKVSMNFSNLIFGKSRYEINSNPINCIISQITSRFRIRYLTCTILFSGTSSERK